MTDKVGIAAMCHEINSVIECAIVGFRNIIQFRIFHFKLSPRLTMVIVGLAVPHHSISPAHGFPESASYLASLLIIFLQLQLFTVHTFCKRINPHILIIQVDLHDLSFDA